MTPFFPTTAEGNQDHELEQGQPDDCREAKVKLSWEEKDSELY